MVTELKGSLYYMFSNLRFSLIVFWGILMVILAFTIITTMLVEDTHVTFNMGFPTYIFAAIFGFWMVKNAIPFLIKMGATRKAIFIAVGIFGIALSLINAILSNTINSIIALAFSNGELKSPIVITVNGDEEMVGHIGQFIGRNDWLSRIVIDSSISFFLFGCLFIGGLIFYKYGIVGGTSFIAIGFLAILYAGNAGWLESFFKFVFTDFSFTFFYQLFAVGVIIYCISILLLRRLTLR